MQSGFLGNVRFGVSGRGRSAVHGVGMSLGMKRRGHGKEKW